MTTIADGRTLRGVCPACGSTSLFAGSGGHVTCGLIKCPDPTAVDRILSSRIRPDRLREHHTVTVKADGWHMAHPLWCELSTCRWDAIAQTWQGAPADLGEYQWQDWRTDIGKEAHR